MIGAFRSVEKWSAFKKYHSKTVMKCKRLLLPKLLKFQALKKSKIECKEIASCSEIKQNFTHT